MSIADEARTEAMKRWDGGPGFHTYCNVFAEGAKWQASRKVEAAPSDTDEEALAWVDRHNDVWLFPGGGDIGYAFETQPFNREHVEKKWGPLEPLSRTSQPVQVEVTALERAMFDVESKHHFHEVTCLCGFSSHRSRSRTEHITAEIRAALGGGDHAE